MKTESMGSAYIPRRDKWKGNLVSRWKQNYYAYG